ncbi:MAG: 30S ribosomal protein S21 [Chloroflexi bacterium]|nr:MAG: 30S ribosomal protein S21 [SAR202 cluster bacterium]MAR86124.1 30S ribosomal protein S21 [Chloroflexota bacterium]PKB60377.1 MAG: 30S ribosomal protein S21 [SAR202 cluster bacterium Ae2-Chloro-G2]KAA1304618.1 MAG: 30S ribosomal protein S21 [SAR202 cluster bacterium]MBS20756.1 30S ribosomal protein S21 [Chloroflexota bacterium]
MAYVTLREGEEDEVLLKRFQTQMQRSGILRELRNRRFFRSKGEQARLDKQRSIRRLRRRRTRR